MNLVRHQLELPERDERFPLKATCLAIYSRAINAGANLDRVLQLQYPWCASFEEDLRRLFEAYVAAKQAQHVLDYDDLLLYWAELMKLPDLASDVGTLFDHVLVDEYQDTNALQAAILLGLKPDGKGLTVVGDDAQSIYSFRAASVRNILDFPKQFTPTATIAFVIASSDYTTLVLIPPLVEAIEAEAPAIHLRIIGYDKADIPDLIDRGEVDVALGVFQSAPERAVRQFLCPERFVGVARRGHPAISGGAISMEDYIQAGHALVSLRRDAIGEIDKILRERNLSRSVVLTLPHMLVLPAILKRSDLLAALPQRVAQLVVGNELQIFDLPMNVPAWRIEMLWNASARSDQASAWLRSKIAFAAASADAKPERRKSADA
jgi:DNA-binding transcriptional LysR family regulator